MISAAHGILFIALEDETELQTNISEFTDSLSDDGTLIKMDSPLYEIVSSLSKGDKVKFSGCFSEGPDDCFSERSFTLSGAINEPEFEFKFTAIGSLE